MMGERPAACGVVLFAVCHPRFTLRDVYETRGLSDGAKKLVVPLV